MAFSLYHSLLLLLALCPFLAESRCAAITSLEIVSALESTGMIANASIISQHSLCEVGTEWVRKSLLYNELGSANRSAFATFFCNAMTGFSWVLVQETLQADQEPTYYNNVADYVTAVNCTHCNSTETQYFADPSFCQVTNPPCDPVPCQNGGTCVRTDLMHYYCSCEIYEGVETWTGRNCENCSLVADDCVNGGTLDPSICECDCLGNLGLIFCDTCLLTPIDCEENGVLNTTACKCDCFGQFHGLFCHFPSDSGTQVSATATFNSPNSSTLVSATATFNSPNSGTFVSATPTFSSSEDGTRVSPTPTSNSTDDGTQVSASIAFTFIPYIAVTAAAAPMLVLFALGLC